MPRGFQWFTSDMKTFGNIWTGEDWVISVASLLLANKPACREDPWIMMRGGGRSGAMKMWSKRWDEMIMDTNKKKAVKYPLFFFWLQRYLGQHVILLHYSERRHANRRHVKNTQEPCPHCWTSSSELPGHFVVKWCGESTYHLFLGNGD